MGRIILRNMVLLTLISVTITSVFTVGAVYKIYNDTTRSELKADALFVLGLIDERDDLDQLTDLRAIQNFHTRITTIATNGEVLFDNWADHEQMDNHLSRREVQGALQDGFAESFRLSSTLGSQTFYYAVLLDDGTILRFAKTTESVIFTLYRLLALIGLIVLGVTLVAIFLAGRMTEGIMTPINNIDLDKPLGNDVYDELSPLLTRIARQNRSIDQQLSLLQHKQAEFEAITSNMTEGLIILDSTMRMVSLNSSALSILNPETATAQEFKGKSILLLTRDMDLQRAITKSLLGERAEVILSVNDKSYEVYLNPIFDGNSIGGLILIFLDITQKYEVEKMRREFSGNVSHELKTPLTSISSYSELMKNDMVKPQDIQKFSQHIYDETQRMIALVEDILQISRLDEKVVPNPRVSVNLLELAKEVVDRLEPVAIKKDVTVSVTGESLSIYGDRQVLFEMIYNLCDNAIKYNRSGGKVNMDCVSHDGKVVLKVSDNGIGIPKQYQGRVFERFYRVDTSHSKKTGGTGLGLSIVKHAVKHHNAEIKLESVENEGTTIRISFLAESRRLG